PRSVDRSWQWHPVHDRFKLRNLWGSSLFILSRVLYMCCTYLVFDEVAHTILGNAIILLYIELLPTYILDFCSFHFQLLTCIIATINMFSDTLSSPLTFFPSSPR